MSDDLKKRLRSPRTMSQFLTKADQTSDWVSTMREALDRIEELEAKLRKSALQELSALGQAQEAYQAQMAVEAKLAKVRTFLDELWDSQGYDARELHDLLIELEGGKDA